MKVNNAISAAPKWEKKSTYRLQPEPYSADAWRSLIWACRQKNRYRFGGVVPVPAGGAADLVPAGRGARWFITPAGAVLLAPDDTGPFGRWGWLQDLQQQPLDLGVFVLSWTPPRSLERQRQLQREQLQRIERARQDHARRVERLPPFDAADVPGPALPSPGRLLLAVSGGWLDEQQARVSYLARVLSPRAGEKKKGEKREKVPGIAPLDAQRLVMATNRVTREVMTADEFAWSWPASRRSWNAHTRRVVMNFLVSAHGMKARQAREFVHAGLLVWKLVES
jgi:hypothetical protein